MNETPELTFGNVDYAKLELDALKNMSPKDTKLIFNDPELETEDMKALQKRIDRRLRNKAKAARQKRRRQGGKAGWSK